MANAITEFVLKHFGQEKLAENAVSFVLGSLKGRPFAESASIVMRTLGFAVFRAGPNGPTGEEISESVEKVKDLLEKEGVSEIDPAKFFAGVIVSAKYARENPSVLNKLKALL